MVTFKLIRYLQLFAAIEVCLVSSATSSQWLSIALSSTVQTFKTKGSCDKIGDQLNNRQVQVCKRNVDFMNSVKMGATLAVQECQHQFRYRRWNCTTVQFEKSPVFGNSVNGGTREAAFVHSISSAGVAFAVTHACSAGKFGRKCGCDEQYKGVSDEGFKWAGCSDDIDFGIEFSKSFVDARERGRKVGKHARVLMNLHNNEAGRQAVKRYMKLQCKCHGVSGSCNVRTCWRTLPNFRQVGDHIKEKFDGATEVEDKLIGSRRVLVPKNRNFKPHTIEDLVYIDRSPDFCAANPNTGSLGTQGRFCNRTSQAIDGCELMCCGRGYSTHMETRTERCECKFFWCCYVRCRECQKRVEVSICK